MKRVLCVLTILVIANLGYSQNFNFNSSYSSQISSPVRHAYVIEKNAVYLNKKTKRAAGQLQVLYAVDSNTHNLLNVVVIEKRQKDFVTVYYYNNNHVAQVITGERKNSSTITNNVFTYTEEDNLINNKELETLSENNEKFDQLKNARYYLANYNSQVANR